MCTFVNKMEIASFNKGSSLEEAYDIIDTYCANVNSSPIMAPRKPKACSVEEAYDLLGPAGNGKGSPSANKNLVGILGDRGLNHDGVPHVIAHKHKLFKSKPVDKVDQAADLQTPPPPSEEAPADDQKKKDSTFLDVDEITYSKILSLINKDEDASRTFTELGARLTELLEKKNKDSKIKHDKPLEEETTSATSDCDGYSKKELGANLSDVYNDYTDKFEAVKFKTEHLSFKGAAGAPSYIQTHVSTALAQLEKLIVQSLDEAKVNFSTEHFSCKGCPSVSPVYFEIIQSMLQSLEQLVASSTKRVRW